ncbi:MAG: UvrD-helicase domain-containing protein, partial [Mariprofundaceae bacterium]|nr:UvrD-helicase domain-containing protein [Mariprofundaceae bacterium]
MMDIRDAEERRQAILPHQSCLVQAPAGSGKTELLIQRILALLAVVDEPEEILALTFTRKAAAEMRERVFMALKSANQAMPESAHAQQTWLLAKKVLQQSQNKTWRLLDCPSRLRLMTIDSFASGLARQLPLLSGFGQSPATADFSEPMYASAVDAVLSYGQQKHAPIELREALKVLILHQECRIPSLRALLCTMLARREQWLHDVIHQTADMQAFQRHIEQCLSSVIALSLADAKQAFPLQYQDDLCALASFAAEQLNLEHGENHVLSALHQLQKFPQADVADMAIWKALVHLLLTQGKAQARKTVTKKNGFPAGKAFQAQKDNMKALLEAIAQDENLIQKLHHIRLLPHDTSFEQTTWQVIESLFIVLKTLASQLWQTFEQHQKVDFVEVMLRAKQALGDEDEVGNIMPSEALLRLDYQIKHILVDEFQDTSSLQIDLLSRLTAGWEDDGRTLFMVGDPMQSIYRFRKAEVSLFLEAADNALPLPYVESLTLQQNFRSCPQIVTWVNRAFSHAFPAENNALAGAIAYTESTPFQTHQGSVKLHISQQHNDDNQAQGMLKIVQSSIQQGRSVGILARSRAHLHHIMQLLQDKGIAFRALDMLFLAKQPEIIDLHHLTRALLHPSDHIAWAALLRSPIIGLRLQSLHDIFHQQPSSAWQCLQNYAEQQASADEKVRLQYVITALTPAIQDIHRLPTRHVVESAWLRLASPALLSKSQLANTDTYFELLETLDNEANIDVEQLETRLAKLYAAPEHTAQADMVELMTMHGAKGLQWDTVILPSLGKRSRAKDKEMLVQTEVFSHQGQQLLLAPLPQATAHSDAHLMYDLVRDFEKKRDVLEISRLLYVACTRAERALHLFGHIDEKSQQPQKGSLLALIWQDETQCFGADVEMIHAEPTPVQKVPDPEHINSKKAQHISLQYQIPQAQASILKSKLTNMRKPIAKPEFSWATATAKAVGIALHAALQHIAATGLHTWKNQDTTALQTLMASILRHEGVSQKYFNVALRRCQRGLDHCLQSQRAAWILSSQHQDAHQEWALTYVEHGICKHVILDRSFIDE